MAMSAYQVHKSWFLPSVLILVVTGFVDALVAEFVVRPARWCEAIGASMLLWFCLFVILPLLRRENQPKSGA